MTMITLAKAGEESRHFLRAMLRMRNKKWILAAIPMAIVCLVWIFPSSSSATAQDSETRVPALVAGPVRIKTSIRSSSNDVVAPGQRAVLMATNIDVSPIDVRMEIRAADNFSRILASTRRILQPGAWATVTLLPMIEESDVFDNFSQGVIGVVLPSSFRGENWSATAANSGLRGVLASLSVEDETTNKTKFVVATNIVLIRSSAISAEATGGQR